MKAKSFLLRPSFNLFSSSRYSKSHQPDRPTHKDKHLIPNHHLPRSIPPSIPHDTANHNPHLPQSSPKLVQSHGCNGSLRRVMGEAGDELAPKPRTWIGWVLPVLASKIHQNRSKLFPVRPPRPLHLSGPFPTPPSLPPPAAVASQRARTPCFQSKH